MKSLKKQLHRWDGMSEHLFQKEVSDETQTALSGIEFDPAEFDPASTSFEVEQARENERIACWAAFEVSYGDW